MPAFWIAPCLLVVQIAILYVPAADPVVSHRPGMLKIADLIGSDDTPIAYRFGETELGSFSFYTGRRVILIESAQELNEDCYIIWVSKSIMKEILFPIC